MKVVGTAIVAFTTLLAPLGGQIGGQSLSAQTCTQFVGTASGGQAINLDLCSIQVASYRSVNFVYYLGNDRVQSQANCEAGTWTTFPEGEQHRPQSDATQRMLNIVCSAL